MNPILLLHGALGSESQLLPLKNELAKSNRLVYTLNFPGHSGKPLSESFGIENFAEDVLGFLNRESIACADIFGYSMGGYVALWLAYNYPKRVNRIVTLGTKFDWSPESAAKEVQKLDPEKIEQKVPAFARILQHRHAPHDWKELMQKTSTMMLTLGQSPLLTEEIFKTLTHKIVVSLGDQDDMADRVYSERVAQQVNGKFILLENTPHPIEKADLKKIAEIILQES